MNRAFSRISTVIACTCLISSLALADTIKLKNGSIIKGKVTTYNEREFTVQLDLGTSTKRTGSRMVLSVDDVESIQFDSPEPYPNSSATFPPPTNPSPGTQPAPNPAPIKPADPIETFADKTVGVIAAADWTSTEIRVRKGQRIVVSASGQIDLGNNRRVGPDGMTLNDSNKLIAERPTGSLIAVIGDDNDEFIPIGSGSDFIAARDGILFLSVNEGNLRDNSGSFSAKVKVTSK